MGRKGWAAILAGRIPGTREMGLDIWQSGLYAGKRTEYRQTCPSVFCQIFPEDRSEYDEDGEQPDKEDHGCAEVGLREFKDNGVGTSLDHKKDEEGEKEWISCCSIKAQKEDSGNERAGGDKSKKKVVEVWICDGAHWLSQTRPQRRRHMAIAVVLRR